MWTRGHLSSCREQILSATVTSVLTAQIPPSSGAGDRAV